MTSRSRVSRGRKTQRLLAEYIRWLFPFAQSRGSSEPGSDIENTPGIDFEVKASRDGPILKALRQTGKRAAKANALAAGSSGSERLPEQRSGGALPVVVWRPDGYGPEKIGEWVMALRLEDGIKLLEEAGYGDKTLAGH